MTVNGYEVVFTGTSIDDVVSDVNAGKDSGAIPGVLAAKVNNKIVLYGTDLAEGNDSTASGQIKIAQVTGTPLANLVRWRDKPVALSIVQARLVGVTHFAVGYIFTYAPFVIASTTGKFG